LFSLGIIGTGLLAIPVLAGSAAYAIGDACGWECSLENKPWEAIGFYSVIGVSTLLGVVIDWAHIDAMQALFWSAVVNGVIAAPMMAVMMAAVSRREIVGDFKPPLAIRLLGWGATAAMAAATIALIVTSLSG
jgi:Mn2+/Fe2+ NRAMP family transporter